jgi:hypothetical protein
MANKRYLYFLLFLSAVSLGGAYLVYRATSIAGSGVSADGAIYLSSAANLLKGRGLVDLHDLPLTLAPPFYPAFLAFISFITRADVYLIGWIANLLACGAIIFLSGILFQRMYPDRMLLASIGSLVVATSTALINTSASILSDPFFMLFVILFLLEVVALTQDSKWMHIVWMGLLACLASLDRYAGLVLVLCGALFLLYFYRRRFLRGLVISALFLISGLPLILWSVYHNYPITGSLFGSYGAASIPGNFNASLEKFWYWFVPYGVIKLATPLGLTGILLLVLIVLNKPANWQKAFQRLFSDAGFINLIFILIYLAVLIFNTSYFDTRDLFFERYHIILLTPLLVVLFAVYEELIPPRLEASKLRIKDLVLSVFFLVWLAYPFTRLIQNERDIQSAGGAIYNSYNFSAIKTSTFLKTARSLPAGGKVYSNYEAAAWFYLRRDILSISRVDPKSKQVDPDSLRRFRKSIGAAGGGYLIWFETINYRDTLPSLDQLNQEIQMKPVFTSDVGDIYYIVSNSP